jgi:hypothetical protein
MFRGYKVNLTDDYFPDSNDIFGTLGSVVAKKNRADFSNFIQFLRPDGRIDASKVEDVWFPSLQADIFISHSHADIDLVHRLVGLFKVYGLSAFVDSSVWGHSDQLLQQIDRAYCYDADRKIYSYEDRNRSTALVHNLLLIALMKVIDKAECVLFLNTPSSIEINTDHNGNPWEETASPWIYSELAITRLIKRRELSEFRPRLREMQKIAAKRQSPSAVFPAPQDHLLDFNFDNFMSAIDSGKKGVDILDQIYEETP